MQVVVCCHTDESLIKKAAALAQRLQWPLMTEVLSNARLVLTVEAKYVALSLPRLPQFKPLYVNFAEGKQAYRLRHVHQEQLVKACKVKNLNRPLTIIDATAGLGKDALLLAVGGASVTMIEQQSILVCLLEDLVDRLAHSGWQLALSVQHANAIDYLGALTEPQRPDVIYLDPMFDHDESKTALVKKDLQMLQVLNVPPNLEDQQRLLAVARQQALYKVVVKRARLAQALAGVKPSYQLLGTHSRFDIYSKACSLSDK